MNQPLSNIDLRPTFEALAGAPTPAEVDGESLVPLLRRADTTSGDALVAVLLILVVSTLLSGGIDNIPYAATMSPPALALGVDFGGTMMAIGARTDVVMHRGGTSSSPEPGVRRRR